ncbi:MAG: adenosylcobinamide amidohydrolase [Candidatus Bathyarchaeota archaeon]|nr:adenosylcobinamide amidohydrolase [Candidatus Bathyarchaeota archaeon]
MRLHTHVGSINAEVDKDKLVILSKNPLKVLSSAGLNGGLARANGIVNIHVTEDRTEEIHKTPDESLKRAVVKLGFSPERVVAMVTAADVRNVGVSNQKHQDITLSAFVTAGVDVSATAGEASASEHNALNIEKGGTINIILLIDGNLTEGCMVDAVKTVTEAKTVALRELDVRSRFSGDLASGTVTDTVVVACTKRGNPMKYAGTATTLGELIGKSVKEAVKKALQKQSKVIANRPLTQRLEERGISIANITTLFSETHPTIRGNSEKMGQFREELQEVFSDPNVASFIIAALRLDEDAKLGLIPEIPVNRCDEKLVVCEILQTAVADYLSKKNVTSKDDRLDYLSSAVADRMGSFTRSILFAVMNAVYSNRIADHSEKCE